jgi:hypothetical protein
MVSRDLKSNVDAVASIAPAVRNAAVNGSGVDLKSYDSAFVTFQVGTVTDGTHTPSVQDSDDNSTFAAVAAEDLDGTLVNLVANSVQRVGYRGHRRYIRAQVTSSGTTGAAYAAMVLRGAAHLAPV